MQFKCYGVRFQCSAMSIECYAICYGVCGKRCLSWLYIKSYIKGFKWITIIQDFCYGSQCFLKFKICFYATIPCGSNCIYGFPFIKLISCSLLIDRFKEFVVWMFFFLFFIFFLLLKRRCMNVIKTAVYLYVLINSFLHLKGQQLSVNL